MGRCGVSQVGLCLSGLLLVCAVTNVAAQGQVFGLAGKRVDDANFVAAGQGCEAAAALQGDRCLIVGQAGPSKARLQDAALLQALAQPLAGLAVSVTHSGFLGASSLAAALRQGVPVVTFDSDLDPPEQRLRRSYIGPDNEAFGRALGELARQWHPHGGVLCMMSGDAHDPNLNKRLLGVRQALSGDAAWPSGQRLEGQGGWRESPRCPWFNGDSPPRALKQMQLALATYRVDAFVSVGAWPLVDHAAFVETMRGIKVGNPTAGRSVFIGTGSVSPAQRGLMGDGLLTGMVSLDFVEMGRQAYLTMKRLAKGSAVEPWVRTGAVSVAAPVPVQP
jgi:ribose transport system substrate-binding protein